jgi:hypothetical protein
MRMAPPRPNILRGIVRVSCGRADGIEQFPATNQSFLASLAPLIAFPLVGATMLLLQGYGARALLDLLATVSIVLVQPVLSFELSRLWAREARWLRFATALNWCQWSVPVLACMLIVAVGLLSEAGVSDDVSALAFALGLGGYGLWLHWFLARHGLELSRVRAIILALTVNVAAVLLLLALRLPAWPST